MEQVTCIEGTVVEFSWENTISSKDFETIYDAKIINEESKSTSCCVKIFSYNLLKERKSDEEI